MRVKGVLGGVAAAMVLAVCAPAVGAADPLPESVSGSGDVAGYDFDLSVTAGPFGQDPAGQLHVATLFDATVTCINMSGAASVTGYRILTGQNAGRGFLTGPTVRSSPSDPAEANSIYYGELSAPPTACPPPGTPPPPFVGLSGSGTISGSVIHTGGPDFPAPFQQFAFPTPTANAGPDAIAQGSDGTVSFAEPSANQIAALADDESGQIAEYPVPAPAAGVTSIAPDLVSADPGMWFTEAAANQIGHISPAGVISEYPVPTAAATPEAIAGAARGGAWFTESSADKVGHISETRTITENPVPTAGAQPAAITSDRGDSGPAGGARFVEPAVNKIGYIDPTGKITEHAVPTADSGLGAIAADARQSPAAAWFIESTANQIGFVDGTGESSS